MGQIMSQQPHASARRVFVIVDNGSDHRGNKAARGLPELRHDPHTGPRLLVEPGRNILLNRAEKVISPNDFANTAQLAATLLAFINRYNATATPFNWKYTAADLQRHLARLDAICSIAITGQAAPAAPQAA